MTLYSIDAAITQALNGPAGRFSSFDAAIISISSFGVPILVAFVAVQWWLPRDRKQDRHVILATGLSFLAGLALNQIVLLFVHRLRPYDAGITHLIVEKSADYSFPSDHATAVFAIAVSFLIGGARKRGLWILAGALLIALTRVYIGTHYISDIIGGAATGASAAFVVSILYRRDHRLVRALVNIF